jgi:hypothetical protein
MNIDFSQIPHWVRWLVQDANGSWWAHEHEPNLGDVAWYENEVGHQLTLMQAAPESDWRQSLMGICLENSRLAT